MLGDPWQHRLTTQQRRGRVRNGVRLSFSKVCAWASRSVGQSNFPFRDLSDCFRIKGVSEFPNSALSNEQNQESKGNTVSRSGWFVERLSEMEFMKVIVW
jgi:hypothetical protein